MDLILIVLPAFLIFGAGFIGQKMLHLNVKSISTMALYLMTPFLTFETFYSNKLNIDYFYMFSFSVLLIIILLGVTLFTGWLMKMDKAHMSAMLLGTLFPNSGNYGAPVVLFAYGTQAFNYAVILMVIHGLLINSIGIFIASYGGQKSATIKNAVTSVVKMPNLYGVILGVSFQLLHLKLPSTIVDSVSLVGSAAIPTIMLILGMQLAEIKPQKLEYRYFGTVTLTRMVASPLIATILVIFMPVSDTIKNVFILLAAMPVAANVTMLAVQFDAKPNLVSLTTLITTIISLLTIPLTLFFLG
ncbi:AEC family transporter [Bacillus timonensis]|uniref:AEC family transporter n=1 Tax=Bacillus timonensis TaxID=1033734 RepID=A0A4S3PMA5_9BACI|nr:AEC family transporter [Bacillus timonensis]THE10528.1 AEC family transporter [Bacillus timonensis]